MNSLDSASDESDGALPVTALSAIQGLLLDVEDAMRRIEDGTYGNCQATGAPIPDTRLRTQEAGLVAIVEPEVLMDGDHSMDRHFEVTELVLRTVFQALFHHRVPLEAMLLKPNMVLAGKAAVLQATVEESAKATLRCMLRSVPASVPGIVFLSGGQTPVQATTHLNELNRLQSVPWQLSFSYGRALQEPVLKTWKGNANNISAAQTALAKRARLNSAARRGHYSPAMET